MTTPADLWERCPVCRARLKEAPECPRCRLDFAPILDVVRQAEELREQARYALKTGRRCEAFHNALQAVQMHLTARNVKALAVAALSLRHFDLALGLWSWLRDVSE